MLTSDSIFAIGVNNLNVARNEMNPVTVSYTHLRAHETVLDLVCRLLLENKKNKTTTVHQSLTTTTH